MKSTLTLSLAAATLALLSAHALAADTTTYQSAAQIAPQAMQNLYSAAPPAPEPSQSLLLMSGLIGFALRRRR